ncbi:monoheme cytochrome C [Flavobacteriaceae bacterium F89]|uniref:Monoheme cytochrome C n=1 Tax=Cerina litoralis TaxID=2874477 RepID=A0AAE3EYD8_9FLAO|nr:monoheme cytochrome C [Cerina litoralis]MCG2461996.1 monoheme cytochrome C [Cerina litoralis]
MKDQSANRNKRIMIFGLMIVLIIMIGMATLYFMDQDSGPHVSDDDLPAIEAQTSPTDSDAKGREIDKTTGFIVDTGMSETIQNCTPCHSAKMVTQNRMTRDGWLASIRWMQETQNLWPLGDNEPIILDYLAKNYAPANKGRREPLTNIEWYKLK